MAAMELADETLANATDLLRADVARADRGLQNETERVEADLIGFKLKSASENAALAAEIAILRG